MSSVSQCVKYLKMNILLLFLLSCSVYSTVALPANDKTTLTAVDPKLSPENQPVETPNLSEMIEVKEEDIANGTWVVMVEEPLNEKVEGEVMETANNIVFRPLFRYHETQESRRRISNRRTRRRYYVPRRSYRNSGYYRPYRSIYSYPYYRYF